MTQMSRPTAVVLSLLSIACLFVAPNPARAQALAVAQVSGTVTDNFGLITATQSSPGGSLLLPSVGDPRILQFALKLHF